MVVDAGDVTGKGGVEMEDVLQNACRQNEDLFQNTSRNPGYFVQRFC